MKIKFLSKNFSSILTEAFFLAFPKQTKNLLKFCYRNNSFTKLLIFHFADVFVSILLKTKRFPLGLNKKKTTQMRKKRSLFIEFLTKNNNFIVCFFGFPQKEKPFPFVSLETKKQQNNNNFFISLFLVFLCKQTKRSF